MTRVEVIVSSLLFLNTLTSAHGAIRNKLFSYQPELSDRLFTQDELFELQSASGKLKCAVLCARTPCCASFTFAQSGVCRGHKRGLVSNSSGTAAVGAKTFLMPTKEVSGKNNF